MSVNEEYERLYKTAVDDIIEAMAFIKSGGGNGHASGDMVMKKKDLIDRWAKIIQALAPPPQLDLDLEAVEAIRRTYTKP